MSLLEERLVTDLYVRADGILPTDAAAQVHANLRAILGSWASRTSVRLTRLSAPAAIRPVVAQLNLAAPHGPVRAQVAAATTSEAVLRLAARTHAQLQLLPGLSGRGRPRPVTPARSWWPELLRPPAERRLSRTKHCVPETCTVDLAIQRLEALDREFHLFHESVTGQDCLLERVGPASYRLHLGRSAAPGILPSTATPVTVLHHPAPILSVPVAVAQLALTGRPFLFFADPLSRRGRLLYLRYDGDYALIRPATP